MKTQLTLPALAFCAAIAASSFTPLNHEIGLKKPVAKKAESPMAPTVWTVDKAHSNVKFTVTHMVVSEVGGTFKVFDGTMEHTKPDYSDAKINFMVDVTSINTDNERRDGHLKGDDFFNAEKYPQMKFVSTSFTPSGDNKYKLAGDLTIRDVTKPVVFDVTYGGTINDKGATKSGFKAKTTINRFDYNLKWNAATEAGGLVVSKDVDVMVYLELKKS
jgi:polyisoprenoid-binding protein YceI